MLQSVWTVGFLIQSGGKKTQNLRANIIKNQIYNKIESDPSVSLCARKLKRNVKTALISNCHLKFNERRFSCSFLALICEFMKPYPSSLDYKTEDMLPVEEP